MKCPQARWRRSRVAGLLLTLVGLLVIAWLAFTAVALSALGPRQPPVNRLADDAWQVVLGI